MTPFAYANGIVFCFTLIAFILASITGVICFAMGVFYKLRLRYVLPEFVVSLSSLLLFCYLSDGVRIRYFGANPTDFSGSPCFMPTWAAIVIALALIALVIMCLALVVKKRLSALTAMSVKEAISELPVGLCFCDENGKVLLLNEQASSDCVELTGEPLYDGNAFWSSVSEGKVTDGVKVMKSKESIILERADGRVLMCRRIAHVIDGKSVYEICDIDISREFALKKEKDEKNDDLKKMKNRLLKYGEVVTEVTRERENLAARVKVHSNLGSLIVRTKRELMQGNYDSASLISSWNDILPLLFASDDEQDMFAEADKTAANLGVRIFYSGKRPEKGTQAKKIFASAVFECVTNAVRHADATELYVTMTESEKGYSITLTNDGREPEGDIKEGGGISNLRTMAENAGGRMTIESVPRFALSIIVPRRA